MLSKQVRFGFYQNVEVERCVKILLIFKSLVEYCLLFKRLRLL